MEEEVQSSRQVYEMNIGNNLGNIERALVLYMDRLSLFNVIIALF